MARKYDGFYQLADSENPQELGKYVKRSDGTVVVPVADALGGSYHDADTGISVEETNYAELVKAPDYSQLAGVLGKGSSMQEIMAKAEELKKEAKEAPVPTSSNPTHVTESNAPGPLPSKLMEGSPVSTTRELPERIHEVTWDTPMGQFSVTYRNVLVSPTCLIFVNKPTDKPRFTPVRSSKTNPIMYTVTYNGVQYTGLFLGVSAHDDFMDVLALHITETRQV